MSTTDSGPTSTTSWANTVLTEFAVADCSVVLPPPSAFTGCQGPSELSHAGSSIVIELGPYHREFRSKPCSIAAASVNALNAEPGAPSRP